MSDRVASKAEYWRTFGVVLGAHSIAIAVSIGLGGGSLSAAAYAVVGSCAVFGLWAAMAPRGAAIGLVVILMIDIVTAIVLAARGHLAAAITIPFDALAVVFAIRSLPIASAYLDARRNDENREREYDRQERWRSDPSV